ncbi:MAG TPA: flagellar protein FlaG [Azospira sp.]|nr:flagellar protein FlaG [Azospira sp.]
MDISVSGLAGRSGVTAFSAPTQPLPAGSAPRGAATVSEDGRKAKAPTQAALQQAVDRANQVLETKLPNELAFSVDKDTGSYVVKMIDRQTGKTLRQFPSEEMLEISRAIGQMKGALLKQQA